MKHQMRRIGEQTAIEMQQIVRQNGAKMHRPRKRGVEHLRQKQAVETVIAVGQRAIAVMTAAVDEHIVPRAQARRLPVQRVQRLAAQNIGKLQKAVVMQIDRRFVSPLQKLRQVGRVRVGKVDRSHIKIPPIF